MSLNFGDPNMGMLSMFSLPGSSRKRLRSSGVEEETLSAAKRARIISSSNYSAALRFESSPSLSSRSLSDVSRSNSFSYDGSFDLGLSTSTRSRPPYPTPPASRSSSFEYARGATVLSDMDLAVQDGLQMMRRSYSSSDLVRAANSPYPEPSAHHHLRPGRDVIDYSVASLEGEDHPSAWPLSWSSSNVLFFSRGNRVYYRNLSSNIDAAQLCKIKESHGALRLIEAAGMDQPNVVAVGSSKGYIQLWDVSAKKVVMGWSAKSVGSMKWNGPVLTVGGSKGTIRHYDTRIKESSKMKEKATKVTRHQARISALAWNQEVGLLASGDELGNVFCWDPRQSKPLDVGEQVHRRKKVQHVGIISALAWCPWQPKLLATGDSSPNGTGTIRFWNINTSHQSSNASGPAREMDAQITSLHFSPHCRELLTTHGAGAPHVPPLSVDGRIEEIAANRAMNVANSVVVHSYQSWTHVITRAASTGRVAGSVLNPTGTKLAVAAADEGKLSLWEVWGKRKEAGLKRQASALDLGGIR
ncbi:hypothetical protein JAAARDRAFT_195207 [Jaapia argillacea MUCL 33604]|uniref:Uncharacterized protein n=1 Tax=Jaapia argillacea MUCL 33604 TaxID=933084 RepID=A0A067PXI0_9AGAM|nr:hypothetical protein JAAARDRAFT_195207 [Jaapia argillacea MUCL 33604]